MNVLICKPSTAFVEPCCGQYLNCQPVFSSDIFATFDFLTNKGFNCNYEELNFQNWKETKKQIEGYTHVILFAPLGDYTSPKEKFKTITKITNKIKNNDGKIIGVIRCHGYLKELMDKYINLDIGINCLDTIAAIKYLIKEGFFDGKTPPKRLLTNSNIKWEENFQENLSFLNQKNTLKKYSYTQTNQSKQRSLSAGTGCPHHCTYCQLGRTSWSSKPPEQLAEEMSYWNGYNLALFHTNIFHDHDWLKKLLNQLKKREPEISFRTLGRLDDISNNLDLLPLCSQVGMERIDIGFESADPKILNSMQKNINNEKMIHEVFKKGKENNILIQMNVLIGMPEESKETLKKTYEVIKEFGATFNCSILRPEPGTPVYQTVINEGLATQEELNFENFLNTRNKFKSEHQAHVPTKHLSKKEISDWHKKITKLITEKN